MHPIVLAAEPAASSGRLVPAALAGIALIVVLITYFKVHPFLSLTLGSVLVGAIAGLPMADTIEGFGKGFGDTAAASARSSRSARCSASCWPTPAARTRSSTPSSGGPGAGSCRGRWPSSAR
ncbi:hypothetical protein LUX39_49215 [Actinomadura madurae]|nr:hypothetical protein [Actinomadura madurae]MCP9971959.1 hypothetical protein [Actinomadura madurae]MCQ0020656.1 hypothetical protein [Actinomadura madurae]